MQEKIVVLIGITGNGQTSLFNKICNAQETVKAGGQSLTLKSVYKNSAYGNGFKLHSELLKNIEQVIFTNFIHSTQ